MTVLLVEQHVHRALALADQAWLLERGQIRLSGDAKALAQNPYVREVYLGQH
jgi:branched-chain amino acid transport system ATP-binding protein